MTNTMMKTTTSSSKSTDVRVTAAELYLLPVETRMPIKFGTEVFTGVTYARVRMRVTDRAGNTAVGWGETPLSIQWCWPSNLPYAARHDALIRLCRRLAEAWAGFDAWGHPLEIGSDFIDAVLRSPSGAVHGDESFADVPYLAALVCASAFDLAVHDAYGNLHRRDVYSTYTPEFMNRDLAAWFGNETVPFAGRFPGEFLVNPPPTRLPAWHLIGGLDPLTPEDLTGAEPDDEHPVLLTDWIEQDGLKCLKIKLRGTDADWDYDRIVRVGEIAQRSGVIWLTADFNCTVSDPEYVNAILDRLRDEHSRTYGMLLYVEQPFPYDLEKYAIDARSVAARKPVFLDESAHDWEHVRLGRELGWSGVALKTCKTQSGAILSLCWAKAHGMPLMVQDLANGMLAQIPHLRLGAHAGTIMGVETNGMQFYPEASRAEAAVHPGMYRRQEGRVDLGTLGPTGFGYRVEQIARDLPPPDCAYG